MLLVAPWGGPTVVSSLTPVPPVEPEIMFLTCGSYAWLRAVNCFVRLCRTIYRRHHRNISKPANVVRSSRFQCWYADGR